VTHVGQVYCQPLSTTSPEQLPESRSGPAAPRVPAHKSVVVKVVLMCTVLVGIFRFRAATSASSSVVSISCALPCCRRRAWSEGIGTLLSFPGAGGCQGHGEDGTRGARARPGTTAERRGQGVQWHSLLGTSSSFHTDLGLEAVISRCIYCVLIQRIHAVESGG